ncbi:MAG: hypothetical protein KDC44_14510 [Phaeodactylibacter sp.]|nr:hypothetical protein [Phaeodactylibacter sp.]
MTEQPSINILGIILDEPTTTVTDLIIAGLCFYACFRLWQKAGRTKAQGLFAWYFFLLGLGTTLGGLLSHGFKSAFTESWKIPGWEASILAIFFLTWASVEYTRPAVRPWISQSLLASMGISAVIFSGLMLYQMTVIPVVAYTGVGMWAVIFPLQVMVYSRTRDRVSWYSLLALFSTMLAAMAFLGQISLDKWFNHIDLSHVFLFLAVLLFYWAAEEAGKAAA